MNAPWLSVRKLPLVFVAALFSMGSLFIGSCVDTAVPDPVSAVAYCEGLAALDCKIYWTCAEPTSREAERASLLKSGIDIGTDQQSCTTNLQAGCMQRPFSCGPNETYQETKASRCLESLQRLSCEAWLSSETAPLNCAKVCTSTLTNL